jgi:uncharacterized protein YndB with AHSA1/START domain
MSYELRVERVLNASAEEVFDAYTDVAAQRVWFRLGPEGPDEDSIVEIEGDVRVGGVWEAVWGNSRDQLFRERGVFEALERPRRVVMASTVWTPDGQSTSSTVEVTFDEHDGKTRMIVVQRGLPSTEVRDFLTSTAWPGAFDRIERYLRLRQAA